MRNQRQAVLLEEERTRSIIGAFFEVYNYLGYGFVEKVYAAALERELVLRGHGVRREVTYDVAYKGAAVARHRIDVLVDDAIIVETKASAELPRWASQQLQSYLGASPYEVGLLLHFGPTPRFFRLVFSNSRKQHLLRNGYQRPSADSAQSASTDGELSR